MSLRPEIYGFDKAKMFALFGSKNEKAAQKIVKDLEEMLGELESDEDDDADSDADAESDEGDAEFEFDDGDDDEEANLHSAKDHVRAAIFEGVPIKGTDVENMSHVLAAKMLAEFDQGDMLDTESSVWKMNGFWEFMESFEKRFDEQSVTLMNYLIEGRPLFGESIDTGWSYYAYLSLDEVKALRAAIKKQHDWAEDLTKKGQLNEIDFSEWTLDLMESMLEWFDQLIEAKRDLWFMAN